VRNSINLISTLIFLVVSSGANSRSLSPVDLAEITQKSDIVAVVAIEAVDPIHGTNQTNCGARYVAKVSSAVKGAAYGARLLFRHWPGKIVGQSYLIFLSNAGAEYDFTFLPFNESQPNSDETTYRESCEAYLPSLRESYDGYATLPVLAGSASLPTNVLFPSASRLLVPSDLKFKSTAESIELKGVLVGPATMELDSLLERIRRFAALPK
jgi:hypothetical protein